MSINDKVGIMLVAPAKIEMLDIDIEFNVVSGVMSTTTTALSLAGVHKYISLSELLDCGG